MAAFNRRRLMTPITLEEYSELQMIKGVPFPAGIKFRQIIITGPPGSGKTSLIAKIGGWYEEGYVDISARNWWRMQHLTFRPREIHLLVPIKGMKQALAVHDPKWREQRPLPHLDYDRICIPPAKTHIFSSNWQGRYVFEFLLLPPEKILELRQLREQKKTHHIDRDLTLELIKQQVETYQKIAIYFQKKGLMVYLRDDFDAVPKRIIF